MSSDEREADQQEEQAGEPVLQTDDLVVGGEDVPAEQSQNLTQPCERKRAAQRTGGLMRAVRMVYIAARLPRGARTSIIPSRS